MRFDKWTYVIGSAAVAAAVILGALAGAGPGVLAALAGLASAVLWQAAANHRAKLQATSDLLQTAERELASPQADADSPAMYLRAEAAVVPFQQRPELATLRDWLVSGRQADVALVIGEGGAGKTRLALQLAGEAEQQYGFRCYWVPAGGEQQAADAARHGETPVLLITDYAETRSGLARCWPCSPRTCRARRARAPARPQRRRMVAAAHHRIRRGPSDTLAAISPMPLGPLAGPSGQQEVFGHALAAFAAELHAGARMRARLQSDPKRSPWSSTPPRCWPSWTTKPDAAAANGPAGGPAKSSTGCWATKPGTGSTPRPATSSLSPAITDRAVAVGTLIGADDEASATQPAGQHR